MSEIIRYFEDSIFHRVHVVSRQPIMLDNFGSRTAYTLFMPFNPYFIVGRLNVIVCDVNMYWRRFTDHAVTAYRYSDITCRELTCYYLSMILHQ